MLCVVLVIVHNLDGLSDLNTRDVRMYWHPLLINFYWSRRDRERISSSPDLTYDHHIGRAPPSPVTTSSLVTGPGVPLVQGGLWPP